eukprot:GCRY01002456.1.p1 GENE.GCRY01002456.1~~GCRY01002456.1.p1  ORF type:complete len:489 (-),score=52.67 GCRY01002456.1:655-2121(-)
MEVFFTPPSTSSCSNPNASTPPKNSSDSLESLQKRSYCKDWNVEEVSFWLANVRSKIYKPYVEAFQKAQIDGKRLLSLSEKDLENLGVVPIGHQIGIVKEVNDLKFIDKSSIQPRRKKSEQSCANCGTTDTPCFRIINNLSYCNACGLYFKKWKSNRNPNQESAKKRTKKKSPQVKPHSQKSQSESSSSHTSTVPSSPQLNSHSVASPPATSSSTSSAAFGSFSVAHKSPSFGSVPLYHHENEYLQNQELPAPPNLLAGNSAAFQRNGDSSSFSDTPAAYFEPYSDVRAYLSSEIPVTDEQVSYDSALGYSLNGQDACFPQAFPDAALSNVLTRVDDSIPPQFQQFDPGPFQNTHYAPQLPNLNSDFSPNPSDLSSLHTPTAYTDCSYACDPSHPAQLQHASYAPDPTPKPLPLPTFSAQNPIGPDPHLASNYLHPQFFFSNSAPAPPTDQMMGVFVEGDLPLYSQREQDNESSSLRSDDFFSTNFVS